MNVLCLGSEIVGAELAAELVADVSRTRASTAASATSRD